MTERINHAAQARRVLSNAPHEFIQDTGIALAWAQVHATLALVEQQRIANLIAIMTNAARQVGEGTASGPDFVALHSKLNPLIEEGLGLS